LMRCRNRELGACNLAIDPLSAVSFRGGDHPPPSPAQSTYRHPYNTRISSSTLVTVARQGSDRFLSRGACRTETATRDSQANPSLVLLRQPTLGEVRQRDELSLGRAEHSLMYKSQLGLGKCRGVIVGHAESALESDVLEYLTRRSARLGAAQSGLWVTSKGSVWRDDDTHLFDGLVFPKQSVGGP
jgi:hypothetical protein